MSNVQSFVLAGLGVGVIFGLSSGVALGGTAYNGVFVFGPIGAFIGWLIARGHRAEANDKNEEINASIQTEPNVSGAAKILFAILALFALLWNFQIDLLRLLHLMPIFMQKPWLFLVLAVLASLVFPPFLGVYFFAYLGALHFGSSEETGYRAIIK